VSDTPSPRKIAWFCPSEILKNAWKAVTPSLLIDGGVGKTNRPLFTWGIGDRSEPLRIHPHYRIVDLNSDLVALHARHAYLGRD
jgi:hypothetical protein